ncbi:MAG TPA: pyrimidine reductase family protein [Kribbella sp.]|nr:pyrimidine reductase family protein [Kribbella sp.]
MIRRLSAAGAALTDAELIQAYQVEDRSTPYLRANMVASIDGAVEVSGLSGALSSPDDQEVFRRLRMLTDVVLVGAGTVRAEGYSGLRLAKARQQWRREHGLPDNPRLAVVTSRLDLDPGSPAMAESAVRPLVLTHAAAPADRLEAVSQVADVVICGQEAVDALAVKAQLVALEMPQILCEGGPLLLGALTAADLVDELCLSVSPLLAGPGAGRITAGPLTPGLRRLVPHQVLAGDDGTLLIRYVRDA